MIRPDSTRAGTSTTSSSASPARTSPLRTSTSWTAPSSWRASDEPRRRLAVEGAAALLEQRGLLGQRRVAVQLEQLALDLRPPSSRAARRRAARRAPRRARRSSAGSRTGRRRARRAARGGSCDLRRRARRRARRAARGRTSRPSRQHAAHPRQVVEADLVDDDPGGLHARAAPAKRRWSVIATLQSPTARWPASSSARVTIPTGFVKSTIQASGSASSRDALGDLEHDRHRAQRLRQAAGAGRLLADAAARERQRLVAGAGRPGRRRESGRARSRRRRAPRPARP